MPWTFSWLSNPKKPWIQYILKVVICPLISRWRFEGLSLWDVRFLLSQRIFFLRVLTVLAAHTSILLPCPKHPPSRTPLRLHLIGTQNQLKNWKKMHKLLITWTGWWNSNRRPLQPAPAKRQCFLLCSCSVRGCGWAQCQGASSNLHMAAHLFQELIHITETTRSDHQAWRLLHIPITSARLVHSVWEALHRHPLNKWAGVAWCWLLNPATPHLLPSQCKESLLFLAAVADRHLRREGQGVERQHSLKDSWHKSGKKANTESQSTASAFLRHSA